MKQKKLSLWESRTSPSDLFSSIKGDKFDFLHDDDPTKALLTGKVMAKAWAKTLTSEAHTVSTQAFVYCMIENYWKAARKNIKQTSKLPALPSTIHLCELDSSVLALCKALGNAAAKLPVEEGSYLLGVIYTNIIHEETRSANGVFYTPPALVNRLLDLVETAGIDWKTTKVIDPACGGAAFIVPVATRMARALKGNKPEEIISHISANLKGFEIDPLAAWLSQVFTEIALAPILHQSKQKITSLVTVCNSLDKELKREYQQYDLVIGNPPYGKVTLSKEDRKRFARSLYGHANMYGLFTDLALNLTNAKGVIAYVTPTGFLAGEYFKNLRKTIVTLAPPQTIDFVSSRKGVFDEVLQETLLATYKKGSIKGDVNVNLITPSTEISKADISPLGQFPLPNYPLLPWILPRNREQAKLVRKISVMKSTLADWGYSVSTGPLVWNRKKDQLSFTKAKKSYPLIWAEAISLQGEFNWKAEKKNHAPYFELQKKDTVLLTTQPCVLLQRTTAKEQQRRLIAAALPLEFIKKHGGVVIENHVNMIKPTMPTPAVSERALACFLNSVIADNVFRCVSGSVAVSAYELESLPLPPPEALGTIERLLEANASKAEIEMACNAIYNDTNDRS